MLNFQVQAGAPQHGDISKGVSAAYAPVQKEYTRLLNKSKFEYSQLQKECASLAKEARAPLKKLGDELIALREELIAAPVTYSQPGQIITAAKAYDAKFWEYEGYVKDNDNYGRIAKVSTMERVQPLKMESPKNFEEYRHSIAIITKFLAAIKTCRNTMEAIDKMMAGNKFDLIQTITTPNNKLDEIPVVLSTVKTSAGKIDVRYSDGEVSAAFTPALNLKQKIKKNE